MALVDSMEEFGMQDWHKSIHQLYEDENGVVHPVINQVDQDTLKIAKATNLAISQTAGTYPPTIARNVTLKIIHSIDPLLTTTNQNQWPLMLGSAIPPMNNHDAHFADMRDTNVLTYPSLN